MKDSGYVILHRSMLEWEWYGDEAVKVLFLHLLLKANWKPGKFRGQDVPCGSMICSIEALAANLGWTRSRVRHTLDKLKATGEVTSTTTNHWTTLTIVNWAKYQGGNQRSSQPTAIKAANKQPTNSQPTATIEEGKNSNKGRINRESTPSDVPVIPITVPAPELNWPRWAGEQTRAKWTEFVAYRKREHRKAYKSTSTEQKALDLACRWFQSGPVLWTALEHTMAKGWQFPVDPSEHKYPEPNIPGVVNAKPVWNPRA